MTPLVPLELCADFERELALRPDSVRLLKLWGASQKLIAALGIPAVEWARLSDVIYGYFEKKHLSPDYAKKIIRVLNMWGEFACARLGLGPYSRVKSPSGYAKGRIERRYRDNLKADKASDGLSPDLLLVLKSNLPLPKYRWLHISFWFGLRPQEVENLKTPPGRFWAIERDGKRDWLCIQQTKLSNLLEEDRWKRIPVLYPEQKEALAWITAREFDRPLPKSIKRITRGNHHLYAGRKGFSFHFWDIGHDLVEVSEWLGHKSVERTYRDYMRWKRMKLRKIG